MFTCFQLFSSFGRSFAEWFVGAGEMYTVDDFESREMKVVHFSRKLLRKSTLLYRNISACETSDGRLQVVANWCRKSKVTMNYEDLLL